MYNNFPCKISSYCFVPSLERRPKEDRNISFQDQATIAVRWNKFGFILPLQKSSIGPLQLAIHVVQNRRAGEKKSHWDKTNKENYHLKSCMSFVCLVAVRLLLCSTAVLYHVNGWLQRAYSRWQERGDWVGVLSSCIMGLFWLLFATWETRRKLGRFNCRNEYGTSLLRSRY